MTSNPGRLTADTITDDALDALYADRDRLRLQRDLLRTGCAEREALLTECRDRLEGAGYARAHGDDWPQIAPAVAELIADRDRLAAIVRDLNDPDPCWYDHHGYCQAHGWTATDPKCPHARARDLLATPGDPADATCHPEGS